MILYLTPYKGRDAETKKKAGPVSRVLVPPYHAVMLCSYFDKNVCHLSSPKAGPLKLKHSTLRSSALRHRDQDEPPSICGTHT